MDELKQIRKALDKAYDFKYTDSCIDTLSSYTRWRDAFLTEFEAVHPESAKDARELDEGDDAISIINQAEDALVQGVGCLGDCAARNSDLLAVQRNLREAVPSIRALQARLASASEQGKGPYIMVHKQLWAQMKERAESTKRKVEEMLGLLTEAYEMLIVTPEPESGSDRALKHQWIRTYRRWLYAKANRAALATPAEGTTREGERDTDTSGIEDAMAYAFCASRKCSSCHLSDDSCADFDNYMNIVEMGIEALAHEATGGKV